MQVNIETEESAAVCYLSGELDHHNAPAVREKIDEFAVGFNPQSIVLDFGGVTFMDSSGIGLVMGRYKLLSAANCTLTVRNLSPHAYKVMRLAGLENIVTLKKCGEKGGKQHDKAEK